MLERLSTTDESLAGAYFILKFEPIMALFSEEIGEIIQFTRWITSFMHQPNN